MICISIKVKYYTTIVLINVAASFFEGSVLSVCVYQSIKTTTTSTDHSTLQVVPMSSIDADVKNMMNDGFDEVQAGTVEVDEYSLTPAQVDCIREIFTQFDKDKSGAIEKKELNSLAIALGDEMSPAELADCFKSVDKDNSGKITWDEFITYWKNS